MKDKVINIDVITCPHCGYKLNWDEHKYIDQDSEYVNEKERCPECGKAFSWTCYVDISYSTSRSVDWVQEWENYNIEKKWDRLYPR